MKALSLFALILVVLLLAHRRAEAAGACTALGAGFLNVDACGARGDGKTNDAPAIGAAFAASRNVTCTAGKTYFVGAPVVIAADKTTLNATGCKFAPHLVPSTSGIFDIEANNVTLNGLNVMAGSGGWAVFAGFSKPVAHIMLKNETCDGSDNAPMSGCNQIAAVTDFKIDGWKDISSGYGLLQRSGTNSHSVSVTHFQASDMYGDLIAENSVSGTSTDWSVSSGSYNGAHGYQKPTTEQRFASYTTADGINISNVTAQHANGDSAVHFEGPAKNIRLSDDTFTDNLSSGGSDGYVTYNNSANNITATRIKCVFATAGNAPYCFGGGANSYSNQLNFTDVQCQDTSGLYAFGCFELDFHTGPASISGGGGTGLLKFLETKNTTNLTVRRTSVQNTKMP